MCTAENLIAGIIVACTFIIGVGAVVIMATIAIDEYKERKNSRDNG